MREQSCFSVWCVVLALGPCAMSEYGCDCRDEGHCGLPALSLGHQGDRDILVSIFQLLLPLSIRCKLWLSQGHAMGAEVKDSLTQERSIAPISIGTPGYQHRTEPYWLLSEGGGVSPRACLSGLQPAQGQQGEMHRAAITDLWTASLLPPRDGARKYRARAVA